MQTENPQVSNTKPEKNTPLFGWLFWLAVVLVVIAATFWVYYIAYQEEILHDQFAVSDQHIISLKRALLYKQFVCQSDSFSTDLLLKKINNQQEPLPNSYVPAPLEAVPYQYVHPKMGTLAVRSEVVEPLVAMLAEAREQGIDIRVNSAYRSHTRQQEIYEAKNSALITETEHEKAALPGFSEHQLGTAVDVSSYPHSSDKGYAWLADNAYRFGFILSYPRGAEDVTEYLYEPWHWRYVGVAIAEHIHNNGKLYNHEQTMLLPSPIKEQEELPYEYDGSDLWVWKYLPPRADLQVLMQGEELPEYYSDIVTVAESFTDGRLTDTLSDKALQRSWVVDTQTTDYRDNYGRVWQHTSLASHEGDSQIERLEVLYHADLGYMLIAYQTQEAGIRLVREFTTSCGVN